MRLHGLPMLISLQRKGTFFSAAQRVDMNGNLQAWRQAIREKLNKYTWEISAPKKFYVIFRKTEEGRRRTLYGNLASRRLNGSTAVN